MKYNPQRVVLSEYHAYGAPSGAFMLRQGRYKYLHFADGNLPLLFDLEQDPQELVDLAGHREYADRLAAMCDQLYRILDPEQVNRQAFADQAAMIERLGGLDAIRALPSFNHTPLDAG